MPFPPPPPPPGPPPAPSFSPGQSSGSSDPNSRNLLLQSIRKGTNLKKTVTNDRSAPAVGNKGTDKSDGVSSNNSISSYRSTGGGGGGGLATRNINSGSATLGRNNGLAGLFAGGMPKLKPTGLDIGQSSNTSQSLTSLPIVANNSTLHSNKDGVRKQFSVDVKNRGPPPQPPPANQKPAMPQSASDSVLTGPMHSRSNSTTSLNSSPSLAQNNGWANNTNNLNSNNSSSNNISGINRTVSKAPPGGYGKPNVAPKPPGINPTSRPSPPPKKVVNGRPMVTRAQSMRAPKSPPIAPPTAAMVFPPVGQQADLSRMGMPPAFHQSQDSLLHTPPPPKSGTLPMPRSGTASPNRPRLRPPLTRPPPPPPSRVAMSSPPCPPPPPPPNVAPPPPPHRVAPPVMRFPNAMVNNIAPPPPPIRHSSMRNGMTPFTGDLESRFSDIFHSVHEFPPPQTFLGKPKVYNSKTAKQHAPPPPPPPMTHVQLGNKMWSRDNTSTC